MHRSDFEVLAKNLRPRLIARAHSIVSDKDICEDIVQDCLLKLWSIRDSLDEYTSPEALAMTITHNLAVNELRTKKTQLEINDEIIATVESSPEESIISEERNKDFDRTMSMLPESQQALIRMRHIEGMTIAEIAQVIGSKEGAVRTALSRARNHVAQIFLSRQV